VIDGNGKTELGTPLSRLESELGCCDGDKVRVYAGDVADVVAYASVVVRDKKGLGKVLGPLEASKPPSTGSIYLPVKELRELVELLHRPVEAEAPQIEKIEVVEKKPAESVETKGKK